MPNRSKDWLVQADRDLDQARASHREGRHESEGAPFEHYGPLQSGQAIEYAGEIVTFARSQVA